MSVYFESWLTELCICIFLSIFSYYLYFKVVISTFWEKRLVPYEKPLFVLGNFWKIGISESFSTFIIKYYRKWKDQKMVGLWMFAKPMLIITDLNIIKSILVKDFDHFRDHGSHIDFENEPIAGKLCFH